MKLSALFFNNTKNIETASSEINTIQQAGMTFFHINEKMDYHTK